MIPKNPGTIQKIPQNPEAPPKSTQNNGTSPYHDICKLPPTPPEVKIIDSFSFRPKQPQ